MEKQPFQRPIRVRERKQNPSIPSDYRAHARLNLLNRNNSIKKFYDTLTHALNRNDYNEASCYAMFATLLFSLSNTLGNSNDNVTIHDMKSNSAEILQANTAAQIEDDTPYQHLALLILGFPYVYGVTNHNVSIHDVIPFANNFSSPW